ncbi:MAG: DUF433 domain-containing protein [Trueperaceae bacterium]|nr:DUF433 domain-containing protein [Trueperaceae bacterium]MCO5174950.1 DUF433 domain-containing protein [Trueperaceae bacterium]MCW5819501.1 DUF433 domain-containing protein [Trueperaceae bacterium]
MTQHVQGWSRVKAGGAFFGGQEPGDVPLYTIAAAARYLRIPESTARWWTKGRAGDGYEPVLRAVKSSLLSFNDLVELFVVKQLRSFHGVSLDAIRQAVDYSATVLGVERVLLSHDLSTFGKSVLLTHLGDLVAISHSGQIAMQEIVQGFMPRVSWSEREFPIGLHPTFLGEESVDGNYPITLSPLVAFGSPTLYGTGIKTRVVVARVDAGETLGQVAEDYGVDPTYVKNAIFFENAA